MPNIMFKIGNTDLSDKVISEGYTVHNVPQYTAWEDANGHEHRSVYRERISGNFTMYFPDIDDFDTFCLLYENAKANDTSVRCTVWVNNLNGNRTSDFYIDFDATRYRDAKWVDMVGKVKITIKER